MGPAVNVLLAAGACIAVAIAPAAALAEEDDNRWGTLTGTGWAPSIAVTSGVVVQRHNGKQSSRLEDGDGDPGMEVVPLRDTEDGDDLLVSPSVGAAIELLSPDFALPGGPRLVFGAELVPIFGTERQLAQEGQPNVIRGFEVGAGPASEEPQEEDTERFNPFGEAEANGQGAFTKSNYGDIAYGAHVGLAFPFEVFGRSLRVKPLVGWLRFEVEAEGLLVDPDCDPNDQCTDVLNAETPDPDDFIDGFLRETTLSDSGAEWFDGFGPGLEVELDTGRFGPLSTALFLGARAYYIPGDRSIELRDSATVADQISDPGNPDDPMISDTSEARWKVRVAPWIVRAGLGFRVYWGGRR